MKLNKVTIRNFKGFQDRSFVFAPEFNVVIGNNGAGKTALLDALAVGAGSFFLGMSGAYSRPIRPEEIRRSLETEGDLPYVRLYFPVEITTDGTVAGRAIKWARALRGEKRHTTHGEARTLKALSTVIEAGGLGSDVLFPLISYYGTWRVHRQKITWKTSTLKPGQRQRGYTDCLVAASNESLLIAWFKTLEIAAIQRSARNQTLEGVREAVSRCMDEWTNLYFDVLLDELVTQKPSGERLPVRFLSDGQRTVLFTVLDIAYRAVTLNPTLGVDAPRKTAGVVLIDELDLHLHPKWQRRIVDDLRTAFPELQFIATTHSANIIQSLRPGELIDLEDGDPGDYAGRSPDDILENVMDVPLPQRSLRSQRMIQAAEEYYHLLREARDEEGLQLEGAERRLDELIEPFAENEAYVALLQQKRVAAGIDG